jgi:phosphoglycolate phosphatase-like HAD superfamily hydrolase
VVEDVVKSPLVNGVKEFLDFYKAECPMYVVSATPDREIKEIVERKKLAQYFLGIYGSPQTKADSIKSIINQNGYSLDNTIFIGDSKNDLQAAVETGVLFAARVVDKSAEWLKNTNIIIKFSEFQELRKQIIIKEEVR